MRRALNALETLVLGHPMHTPITPADVEAFARERRIRYDRDEDEHYDTASAFIKSSPAWPAIRTAALCWLAIVEMLEGGEDPAFYRAPSRHFRQRGCRSRRFACDLGLAVAVQQAVDFVGLHRCQLNLSHAVDIFLATCPKSNSATEAIGEARRVVREEPRRRCAGRPAATRSAHQVRANQRHLAAGYLACTISPRASPAGPMSNRGPVVFNRNPAEPRPRSGSGWRGGRVPDEIKDERRRMGFHAETRGRQEQRPAEASAEHGEPVSSGNAVLKKTASYPLTSSERVS